MDYQQTDLVELLNESYTKDENTKRERDLYREVLIQVRHKLDTGGANNRRDIAALVNEALNIEGAEHSHWLKQKEETR